nr:multiple sesquiterpene synthase [Zanthoxylum ailanthoides]
MSIQASAIPASIQNATAGVTRHTANFHPSIWGGKFLTNYSDDSVAMDATTQEEFEGLEQKIRNIISPTDSNTSQKLSLIDTVQRLGVAYHFEKEIEDEIEKLSHNEYDDGNHLYIVALRFRLLRQQGYYLPCDVFDKFKDGQGKFKESLVNDVHGMLSLYEASHLGIRGEDILDEALAFTTSHLESMVTQVSPQLADQILHALNRPLRSGLPRLEASYYMDVYSQDDSKDETILRFAKLDFCKLQVIHRKELNIITEWWKNLNVETKLPYVRDRVVEGYFWVMGVYFEPQYSFGRITLSKLLAITSIVDDTYDAYGTIEELELFTNAIKRWDVSSIDVLPEYMKLIYRTIFDIFGEAEEQLLKEGRSYCMSYVIEEFKKLIQGYFEEAKWCNESYVPKFEEYMQLSLLSSGYHMLATASFLGMGEIANKQAFDWISNHPKIVECSELICRLMNDVVSHEFEQKREHVASAVECYMKQHGVSEEETIKVLRKEIANAWKDTNEAIQKPTEVAMPLLDRIINLSRVIDVVYKDQDGYTNPHVIKDLITTLLVNPLPL